MFYGIEAPGVMVVEEFLPFDSEHMTMSNVISPQNVPLKCDQDNDVSMIVYPLDTNCSDYS